MDLLRTILIYMSMVFISSVQTTPEAMMAQQWPPDSPMPTVMATATPGGAAIPTPTPIPTPALTPNNEYKTLRVGDKGENVKELQSRLLEYGYYTGDVDGSYGNQTRRAVERFQYAHGLSSDGIAGKRTLTVLYESEDIVHADPADTVSPNPTPSDTPLAPTATQTSEGLPKPTPKTQPAATGIESISATVGPTFVPTPTPAAASAQMGVIEEDAGLEEEQQDDVTETDNPASTKDSAGVSTDKEEELTAVPKEGYRLLLRGEEDPLTVTLPDGEIKVLEPMMLGEEMLVPFLEILRSTGVLIVPEEEVGHAEYAFVFGDDLYLLSYDVDQDGKPANLSIVRNNLPQLLKKSGAVLLDETLYILEAEVRTLTGIAFTLDDADNTLIIDLPEPD